LVVYFFLKKLLNGVIIEIKIIKQLYKTKKKRLIDTFTLPVIVLKDVENTVVKYLNFVIEPIPLVFFFFFFLERAFQKTLPLTVEILPKTVEIFTVGFFQRT